MPYSRTFKCIVDYIDHSKSKQRFLMKTLSGQMFDVPSWKCRKVSLGTIGKDLFKTVLKSI